MYMTLTSGGTPVVVACKHQFLSFGLCVNCGATKLTAQVKKGK